MGKWTASEAEARAVAVPAPWLRRGGGEDMGAKEGILPNEANLDFLHDLRKLFINGLDAAWTNPRQSKVIQSSPKQSKANEKYFKYCRFLTMSSMIGLASALIRPESELIGPAGS
jgi:hypothetical protein